jgi:PAS domain S-box-containing protein
MSDKNATDLAQDELIELRQRVSELEEQISARGIQEGEQHFRLMADAAPIMLWVSGADTLCTFFNRRWLQFRGRTMEQEIGNGWLEGVHPADFDDCLHMYLSSFQTRQEFRLEYRLRRADGVYSKIVDSGVPRFSTEGVFAGYVGAGVELDAAPSATEQPFSAGLTNREMQVLRLIADGKSTKEAAADLGISYKTADSHRTRIMEKLGVHETASLIRRAIRLGIVQP